MSTENTPRADPNASTEPVVVGATTYVMKQVQDRQCLVPASIDPPVAELAFVPKSDPDSGRTFYVNLVTRAKSWTLPDVAELPQLEPLGETLTVKETVYQRLAPANPGKEDPIFCPQTLVDDVENNKINCWAVKTDRVNGKYIFVNLETKQKLNALPCLLSTKRELEFYFEKFPITEYNSLEEGLKHRTEADLLALLKGLYGTDPQQVAREILIATLQFNDSERLNTVEATLAEWEGHEKEFIEAIKSEYKDVPMTYRQRVALLYAKYNPTKLATVDETLKSVEGREVQLIAALVKKYGPEAGELSRGSTPVSTSSTLAEYRERAVALYKKYKPEKLDTIDEGLKKFEGQEELFIEALVRKYGPEPNPPPRQASQGNTPRSASQNSSVAPSVSQAAPPADANATPAADDDIAKYRARVQQMYEKYAPEKVANVDKAMKMYSGQEELLIASLVKKYGPEPASGSGGGSEGGGSKSGTPRDRTHSTIAQQYRERVEAMYDKYAPHKKNTIDQALAMYAGREDQLMTALVRKYGPEPKENEDAESSDEEEREKIGASEVKKDVLEKLPILERVERFYYVYNYKKRHTIHTVMKAYAGQEERMMMDLIRKYGPEPTTEEYLKAKEQQEGPPAAPPAAAEETPAPAATTEAAPAEATAEPAAAETTNTTTGEPEKEEGEQQQPATTEVAATTATPQDAVTEEEKKPEESAPAETTEPVKQEGEVKQEDEKPVKAQVEEPPKEEAKGASSSPVKIPPLATGQAAAQAQAELNQEPIVQQSPGTEATESGTTSVSPRPTGEGQAATPRTPRGDGEQAATPRTPRTPRDPEAVAAAVKTIQDTQRNNSAKEEVASRRSSRSASTKSSAAASAKNTPAVTPRVPVQEAEKVSQGEAARQEKEKADVAAEEEKKVKQSDPAVETLSQKVGDFYKFHSMHRFPELGTKTPAECTTVAEYYVADQKELWSNMYAKYGEPTEEAEAKFLAAAQEEEDKKKKEAAAEAADNNKPKDAAAPSETTSSDQPKPTEQAAPKASDPEPAEKKDADAASAVPSEVTPSETSTLAAEQQPASSGGPSTVAESAPAPVAQEEPSAVESKKEAEPVAETVTATSEAKPVEETPTKEIVATEEAKTEEKVESSQKEGNNEDEEDDADAEAVQVIPATLEREDQTANLTAMLAKAEEKLQEAYDSIDTITKRCDEFRTKNDGLASVIAEAQQQSEMELRGMRVYVESVENESQKVVAHCELEKQRLKHDEDIAVTELLKQVERERITAQQQKLKYYEKTTSLQEVVHTTQTSLFKKDADLISLTDLMSRRREELAALEKMVAELQAKLVKPKLKNQLCQTVELMPDVEVSPVRAGSPSLGSTLRGQPQSFELAGIETQESCLFGSEAGPAPGSPGAELGLLKKQSTLFLTSPGDRKGRVSPGRGGSGNRRSRSPKDQNENNGFDNTAGSFASVEGNVEKAEKLANAEGECLRWEEHCENLQIEMEELRRRVKNADNGNDNKKESAECSECEVAQRVIQVQTAKMSKLMSRIHDLELENIATADAAAAAGPSPKAQVEKLHQEADNLKRQLIDARAQCKGYKSEVADLRGLLSMHMASPKRRL